jgi:hypothetical protein
VRGSIVRRGRSSWRIKYDLPGTTERQTRYVTIRGKRQDAERELARLIGAVHDGTNVVPAHRRRLSALLAERHTRPQWQDPRAISRARRAADHPARWRRAAAEAAACPCRRLAPEVIGRRRQGRPATIGPHRRPRPPRPASRSRTGTQERVDRPQRGARDRAAQGRAGGS